MAKTSPDRDHYEVAVCGAGLAGLTFSLLLRRRWPDLPILLVDHQVRPLPEAGFKAGESTVDRWVVDAMGRRRFLQRKLGRLAMGLR